MSKSRQDARDRRRRAKRQRAWEAARPFLLDPATGERFRYRPPALVWIDLSDVRPGDPPGTIGRVIGVDDPDYWGLAPTARLYPAFARWRSAIRFDFL